MPGVVLVDAKTNVPFIDYDYLARRLDLPPQPFIEASLKSLRETL